MPAFAPQLRGFPAELGEDVQFDPVVFVEAPKKRKN